MARVLNYGKQSSLELEVADSALVAWSDAPRGEPLADTAAAVDRAIAEPLGFPPLSKAVVPGDRVAIALDRGVPQAATIVARTVEVLLSAGVSAKDITLVHAALESPSVPFDALDELHANVRDLLVEEVHDPNHRVALSYLGAGADGKPIYINRTICDADFVVSIGSLRPLDSLGFYGVCSGVFPTFSDTAQIQRFYAPGTSKPETHRKLRKLVDQVGWMLGMRFTIQVVPGKGNEVLHVLAGDTQAVFEQGTRLCDLAWNCSLPRRADLIVATIEGAAEQTWENVARALAAVAELTSDEGVVVLCTDLAEMPGPALARMVGSDGVSQDESDVAETRTSDALAAAELVRALERGKVCLISRLEDEVIEDLGMSPIEPDQLSRVAARFESCLVLPNAHRVVTRSTDSPRETATRSKRRTPR